MEKKLDVTLTDFIYAIVVGAAFQKIDGPIWTITNGYLLIAFIIIIDDWVLYHQQAKCVADSKHRFSISLVIDSLVLLSWYCAAVSGAHVEDEKAKTYLGFPRDFHLFLGAFYVLTMSWEAVFMKAARRLERIRSDVACVLLVAVSYFTLDRPAYPFVLSVLVVLWFIARAYAWKHVVFKEIS